MRTIVTGGNGMLGKNIQAAWRNSGQTSEIVPVTRKDVDLTDPRATLRFFEELEGDAIVHTAAKVGGIAANIAHPMSFLLENLKIDTSVLNAATTLGIRRLIYLGSSCMYPRDYRQPLQEPDILAAPLEPTNEGYAIAKIAGAKYCAYANIESNLNYKVIIPSNLYGPHDDYSLKSGHLVAATLRKAHDAKIAGSPSITVWGDGEARREFTYVEDLALWLVENLDASEQWPTLMNVGSGVDYSVLDYYRTALQVVGYECELILDPTKPPGMRQKLMDSSRSRKFGWHPRTSLLDGMRTAYDHYLTTAIH